MFAIAQCSLGWKRQDYFCLTVCRKEAATEPPGKDIRRVQQRYFWLWNQANFTQLFFIPITNVLLAFVTVVFYLFIP